MRAPAWLLALALATAPAAVGCGGATAGRTPEATTAAFAGALREGRYADAYAMMSSSYRRRVPLDDFRRHLEDDPTLARETADSLVHTSGHAEVSAVVPYDDGEQLHMVDEDGSWRIASNVADFYDQSTPRAALRSFVRAIERHRYDVVMRFVPDADKQGMTVARMRQAFEGDQREEISRLVASLRASLDNPIEVVGDRATMPYGEHYTVQFVREDGVWKIENPN